MSQQEIAVQALEAVEHWWKNGHGGYPYGPIEAVLARTVTPESVTANAPVMRELLVTIDRWFRRGEHGYPKKLISEALGKPGESSPAIKEAE